MSFIKVAVTSAVWLLIGSCFALVRADFSGHITHLIGGAEHNGLKDVRVGDAFTGQAFLNDLSSPTQDGDSSGTWTVTIGTTSFSYFCDNIQTDPPFNWSHLALLQSGTRRAAVRFILAARAPGICDRRAKVSDPFGVSSRSWRGCG